MKSRVACIALCTSTLGWLSGCNGSTGAGPGGETDTDGIDPIGTDDDGGSSGEEPPGFSDPGTCVETHAYFRDAVWAPFMSTQCFACHNPLGDARHTDMVLQASDVPGYAEANLAAVRNVARLEIDGESLILLKATGVVEHGGGAQLVKGEEWHVALEELVDQLGEAPITCADDTDVTEFFAGVHMLDDVEVLRRAAFSLASRYPTDEEIAWVAEGGSDGLAVALHMMMDEPAFYGRLVEMFNQTFLTDKYIVTGTAALDLLTAADYPNATWYEALPEGTERNVARSRSNFAVAREPLELIRYIVENDLPFSDIVSGQYTVANPYLARVYGLELDGYSDLEDQSDWQKVQVGELPHAGILTTPAFLNRYPTTDTNRNRQRAQVTLDWFLATDVMSLGARPIATDSVAEHNPTMTNPECTGCHEIMDPVAGAFQNWDQRGRYRPQTWHESMRAPGLGSKTMPSDQYASSLQWLGAQIAADDRFGRAITELVYAGLTGRAALDEPTDPSAPDFSAQIKAYAVQDKVFKGAVERFAESGYDLRELIVALVQTPYYRAYNADALDADRKLELADLGAIRLASPDLLHHRIALATGFTWTDTDGKTRLTRNRPLHLMYGGINSDSVTKPLEQVNGVMANIGERMANEMGCLATAQDFARPMEDRLLFRAVDPDDIPGLSDAAIVDTVVHLHERLLGEILDADDPRVAETVDLFTSVYEDGLSGVAAGEYPATLLGPCQVALGPEPDPLAVEVVEDPDYTIRAWTAVVTAMLGDFRFIYE
ncbi:MAG: DUF1588 domain-containing protein [Myxococcota bacterium]